MKYQIGQQFLIRTDLEQPAFRIRIIDIDEKLDMYWLQQIGHIIKFWVCEKQLEKHISAVDIKPKPQRRPSQNDLI